MTAAAHVVDRLTELVLDTLDGDERAAVERHLSSCAECTHERDLIGELLVTVALVRPEVTPSPGVRARLLASTEKVNRFADFVDRVAGFLDLTAERARALLDKLDDPAAYEVLFPGCSFFVPEHGPKLAGATVGMLRVEPGARFPYHRHGGDEEVLLLQGGFIDEQTGREWHPGEVQPMPLGSAHSFVGAPGPVCLCIGVVKGKLEILGAPPLPPG